MNEQIIRLILVVEIKFKRSLDSLRIRWKNFVKKDLKQLQEEVQIDVTNVREEWKKLLVAVLNLKGLLSIGIRYYIIILGCK